MSYNFFVIFLIIGMNVNIVKRNDICNYKHTEKYDFPSIIVRRIIF